MLSERFELRFSVDLLRRIDEWRRGDPDLPSRAETIRRLIEAGLTAGKNPIRKPRSGPEGGKGGDEPDEAAPPQRAPALKPAPLSIEERIIALMERRS